MSGFGPYGPGMIHIAGSHPWLVYSAPAGSRATTLEPESGVTPEVAAQRYNLESKLKNAVLACRPDALLSVVSGKHNLVLTVVVPQPSPGVGAGAARGDESRAATRQPASAPDVLARHLSAADTERATALMRSRVAADEDDGD